MQKVWEVWPDAKFQVQYLGQDPVLWACGENTEFEPFIAHPIFVWAENGEEVPPPA